MPAFPKPNPTETDPVASPAVSAEATARAEADAAHAALTTSAHGGIVASAEKGAANGVATLGADGKILDAQLGQLAITDVFTVASQAAMLALTAERGDVAIRSDLNKSFILAASPASTLANWKELLTPTDVVTSVNGRQGVVTGLAEQSDLATVEGLVESASADATAALALSSTRAQRLADICRPSKYLATYYVKPDGSGTHTTIAAALTSAATARGLSGTVSAPAQDFYHPDLMVRIIVAPGTYSEQVALPPFTHLIGATGDPNDVVIASPLFKGALANSWSCMVEHITAHGTGTYYAFHFASGRVSVFHNCKFISDVANGQILGMDGNSGTLAIFLGCSFTSASSAIGMNLHGALANTSPVVIAFVDCTHPVGIVYDDLASGQPDRVMVLGGSMPTVSVKGAATIAVVDDAAVSNVILLSGATAQHGEVVPPVAPSFLRPEDHAYYYPTGEARAGTRILAPADVASGNPTAARTYYVPLSVLRYCRALYGSLAVQTAAGTAAVGLASNSSLNKPGTMFANSGAVTLTTGRKDIYLGYPSWLFPGNGVVWAAIQFSDAGAAVAMSTLLSSLAQCYYQDGTMPARNAACTPVALAAGTSVPMVALI